MNYTALRTSVQNNGRFDSSQDTVIKDWMGSAYEYIWNAADWQFKKVQVASLAVTSGADSPTLPTDFGDHLEVYDQYGYQLLQLSSQEFEDVYRADKASGLVGGPVHFKVVNRAVTLGPTPDTTATLKINYTRATCAYQSDGTTVRVGGMSADTDIPFWTGHHMTIVYKTLEIGGALESDNSAVLWSQLAQDAMDAMIRDQALVQRPVSQYGRLAW